MTLGVENIDKKIITRVVSLEHPSKYNIIGLFYCTVQYGVKPFQKESFFRIPFPFVSCWDIPFSVSLLGWPCPPMIYGGTKRDTRKVFIKADPKKAKIKFIALKQNFMWIPKILPPWKCCWRKVILKRLGFGDLGSLWGEGFIQTTPLKHLWFWKATKKCENVKLRNGLKLKRT